MKFKNLLIYIVATIFFLQNIGLANESSSKNKHFLSNNSAFVRMNKMDFYSQASQDKFVCIILYGLLHKQDQGYYLEIGGADPIYNNNSWFFEKNFQWKGVSIDIDTNHQKSWIAYRKNKLFIEDAIKCDYLKMLNSFPHTIDYLSLDIDGYYDKVLERIPFNNYIFKVITIEHDYYRYGDLFREKERQILTSLGYYLLCPDVSNGGNIFEDWWIYPKALPENVFSALVLLDLKAKEGEAAVQIIRDAFFKSCQN